VLFECGLIVFYGENIICFLFFNEVARSVFLGMEGIKSNNTAIDIEGIKKCTHNRDFIGGVFNGTLGNNSALLLEKSGKEVDFLSRCI